MEAFIKYFISMNLLLLLQVGYYRLFLAKQRRFQWNRIYLLGGILLALLLPMMRWEIVPATLPNPSFIRTLPEIVLGPSMDAASIGISKPIENQVISTYSTANTTTVIPAIVSPAPSSWRALEIAAIVYLSGVAIALMVLLMRNLAILRLIWTSKKTRQEGYTLVETTADIGPASYFRFIFWNSKRGLDPQSTAVAMAHERCHSRQLHSLDLVGVELFKAFCWLNPAVYMLRRDLRQTHEFLADEAALQVAGSAGIKKLLLLQQLGSRQLTIANYFYSHVKARIMVLSENSKRKTILQYLLVLPLAGLMVACTSLAHPVDTQSTLASTDTSSDSVWVAPIDDPEIVSLDDILLRATLPAGFANLDTKGMVCLGEMPQVLDLDTVLSLEELENVANHPKMLNRDRIMKLIGYPKEAKEKKIIAKVRVKVLVDESGRVIRYQFLNENDPVILREAISAHVEELLFKPGMKEGKVEKWWVIVPFSFGLPGC